MTWLDGRDRGGRRTRRSGTNWLTLGALLLGLAGAAATSWAQGDAEMKVGLTADVGSMDPIQGQQRGRPRDAGPRVRPAGRLSRRPPSRRRRWSPSGGRTRTRPPGGSSLRKGIQYHDGKELTAERRQVLVRPALASPTVKSKVCQRRRRQGRGPAHGRAEDHGTGRVAPRQPPLRLHPAEGRLPGEVARGVRAEAGRLGALPARALGQGPADGPTAFDGYWGGKRSPARIVSGRSARARPAWPSFLTGGVDVIQDLPVENVEARSGTTRSWSSSRPRVSGRSPSRSTRRRTRRSRTSACARRSTWRSTARRSCGTSSRGSVRRGPGRSAPGQYGLQRRGGEDPGVQPGEGQGAPQGGRSSQRGRRHLEPLPGLLAEGHRDRARRSPTSSRPSASGSRSTCSRSTSFSATRTPPTSRSA